jgi:hypothetical protein
MSSSWKQRAARLVTAVAVARAWYDTVADRHPDLSRARLAALRERELGCALVHVRRLSGATRIGFPVSLALCVPRLVGFRLGSWLVDRELHEALRRAHRRVPDSERAELEVATRFIGLFRSSPGPACVPMGPVPPGGR